MRVSPPATAPSVLVEIFASDVEAPSAEVPPSVGSNWPEDPPEEQALGVITARKSEAPRSKEPFMLKVMCAAAGPPGEKGQNLGLTCGCVRVCLARS